MKFKRLVSILLCIAMILCNILMNFATDNLNIEETTKEVSKNGNIEEVVETTKTFIENEEVVLATDSEVEEEEVAKEYEEEKESDDENLVETSSDENEYTESTDVTESQAKEETSEEVTSEVETSEETSGNDKVTSEETLSDKVISKETTSKVLDSEDIDDIKVSSPSEIEDVEFTTIKLEDAEVSTKSDADLFGDVEEVETIATISVAKEKKLATKSILDKKQNKNYGYMPSSFNAKPAKKELELFGGLMGDEPIPSSYDSREHQNASGLSIVPPVRNQGNYGTCWAFSTIGMFETSLRSKNLVTNENDSNLSEAALAYFTLNLKNVTNSKNYIDKPGFEGRDYSEVNIDFFKSIDQEENGNFANSGGNQVEPILMASTYMGVVKENADTSYDKMPIILEKGLNGKYAFNSNNFEIGNAQFINRADTDLIKRAIMKNGSVGANYCEARNMYNCHKFDDDYYYLSYWWNEGMPNHAIMIVGWDDNIPKEHFYTEDPFDDGEDDTSQATRDGGWLIRNSWGPGNNLMNGGYFWISYEDKSFEDTFYTVEAIPKDTYKYNYHYDTSGNDHDGVISGVPLGNVFKVSDDEDQLFEAINVAFQDASDVNIEIYTNDNKMKSPIDGKKVLTQSFSSGTAGVFTIDLNKDILLKKGTYFSIVLVPAGTGLSIFIDNIMTYEGSPRVFYNEVALGQSFYENNNGTGWDDLNKTETRTIDGITYGQNYRIRALTNPTDTGIIFDANGGEGKMSRQGAISGSTVNIDKNKFTKLGYVFVGWRDENNNFYSDGAKITVNGIITLYAEWEEALKITFVGNGGSYNGDTEYIQYVKRDSEVTLDLCKFEYFGYSFNKWKTTDGNFYSNGDSIDEVSSDIVLTATWTKNQAPKTSGGSTTGGGGGGGGGGKPIDQLQNKPAETTVAKDLSTTPINFNTVNSTWALGNDGKWHLNVVNANGLVEEVKNQWACISKTVDVNGQQIAVQDLYYFDENGNMLTGWLTDSTGKKYFLDNDLKELGKLTRGWKKIDNNYYFFDDKGMLFTSGITPDGYTVSSTGVWLS